MKSAASPSVLIVEDEAVSRRLLTHLLTRLGYTVQGAESAEEALKIQHKSSRFMVALVDLNLPGMDGLNLIAELRKRGADFFPVLITASGEDNVAARAHEAQVTYLRKPLDYPRLMALLSENSPAN